MAVGSGVRAVRTKGNGISVKEQAEVCNIAARRTNNIK
jgi:hypothetical protein